MERPLNFGHLLVVSTIGQEMTKPLIGKPYLRFGHVVGLAGQLFQDSALLAAKYSSLPEAFVARFASDDQDCATATRFLLNEGIAGVKADLVETDSFLSFVMRRTAEMMDWKGDPWSYMSKNGMEKFPPQSAHKFIEPYVFSGAAIGLADPARARTMYEIQYSERDPEKWKFAHESGLAIPATPDFKTYEEAESEVSEMFGNYLREYCPGERSRFGFQGSRA
jgi:hypothetical protein